MKTIWILTIGSSDVQFTADDDKWNRLYRKVRSQIKTSHKFSPTPRPNDDAGEAFLVPARVMGMVYEEQLEENYDDLYFPLFDAFSQKLQGENTPNQIIVILTDQEQVFTAQERTERNCPYWQDTCKLQPIIEKYLKDKFPGATIEEPIYLKPQSKEEGLDNWDKALGLVTKELFKIEVDTNDKIYVSHQASTPAISSAVQFVSLARFGERVNFLVSNEYEKKPLDPIKSEEYLRGIKFQEAKALLERHDYSGVKELLYSYLKPEVKILLDAAIQWNFAKFEDFINQLESYPKFAEDVQKRKQPANWWWTAYEAAYLAVVRLEQGNTVEAMFHSFRAVEGLLGNWIDADFSANWIKGKLLICSKDGKPIKNSKGQEFTAYGKPLYQFLALKRGIQQEEKEHKDIWIFGNYLFKRRNDLFHKLKGLQARKAVFEFWEINSGDEREWKNRVLDCLNFIAQEDLPQEFTSLEEASLMSQVHEELKNAIAYN